MLLVAAIVDFGFYLYDYISTHEGIREGARLAMQGTDRASPSDTGSPIYTEAQIKEAIIRGHGPVNAIQESEITINTTDPDPAFGSSPPFQSREIIIEHTHNFLIPAFMFAESVPIDSRIKTAVVPGLHL